MNDNHQHSNFSFRSFTENIIEMKEFRYFHIDENTSLEDVIKQYKQQAKKYHPDSNTPYSGKEEFQELQKEYQQVLEYLKQKSLNDDDPLVAENIDKLIILVTDSLIRNEKYKPIAKEGFKLIIRLIEEKM